MAEQSVTLNPGESKVVSFEATPSEARTYQVSVDGLTGSFVAKAAGAAKFAYASDVRLQEVTPPSGYYKWWNFQVDIKNIGGTAGSVTPFAHIWTTWGFIDNYVYMGINTWYAKPTPTTLAPGQTATFSGSWGIHDSGWVPTPDDVWIFDYIMSEAGPISFKFGRRVYPISFDIPSQIPSGGEFHLTQVVHLAGGGVRQGSLPQNGASSLEGDVFLLTLSIDLTGKVIGGGVRPVSSCAINALHYDTVVLPDGGRMPMGDMQLLTTDSDYTIKDTYEMQILVPHDGGGEVVSVNVPCKAIYLLTYPPRNYVPIPPGTYDVISTLAFATQQEGYGGSRGSTIWSFKVGQVQVV